MASRRRSFLKKTGWLAAGALLGAWSLERTRASTPVFLRPPGAGSEGDFLARCIRCGQCVEACPTQVLQLAHGDAVLAAGSPYLVAREVPCNLCQGQSEMRCIAECPTGALQSLAGWEEVAMGTAVIDFETCLPWVGVACRACWHICPFPGEAIELDERGRPRVVEDDCVGCGLCEHACLTDVPAIRVRSTEELRRERLAPPVRPQGHSS